MYDGQRSLEATDEAERGTDVADGVREVEILLLKTTVEFDASAWPVALETLNAEITLEVLDG